MVNSQPAVDIVTVSFNSARYLAKYIEALCAVDYPHNKLKLIVVDNASHDDSAEVAAALLPRLPFAHEQIHSDRNLGFAGGCNRGAMAGSAPFLLFLNPDTQVAPDMIRRLVERAMSEPRAGLVEAAQEPFELAKWRDPDSNYTDWCSGAAVLARREAFIEVGLFDTFFFPAYREDVDLSWRMWLAGWKCVYEPSARVRHDTVPPDGKQKPVQVRLSIRFSFAMRMIYDSPRGAASHLVRGLRYLVSPRTDSLMRRAVAEGLWTTVRSIRYLLGRRRAAQSALRESSERDRFVFTEWYNGRWINQ
ncbi:MAG TPA: glycosyltransferase family 2 protein [Blastocatellia bacterium]|nr:glycosyltransferase family 2 protein [Blastocatellia bacterium]